MIQYVKLYDITRGELEKAELYTRFSSPLIEPFKLLGSNRVRIRPSVYSRRQNANNQFKNMSPTHKMSPAWGLELILELSYSGPGRQMNFQISTDFYN